MSKRIDTMKATGADVAARYLVAKGYDIVARDKGPFDVIAREGDVLAFVSVEVREGLESAPAAEGPVDREAVASQMELLAAAYVLGDARVRYDEIAISAVPSSGVATVFHFVNALGGC